MEASVSVLKIVRAASKEIRALYGIHENSSYSSLGIKWAPSLRVACEKGCFMAFRIYLVHLCTCSLENIHVGGNFLSRGIEKGMAYAKFKAHRFAFLNVTTIGPDNVVKAGSECGLACVNSLSCFSFNLAVFHGMNGKLLCQLLPTDIYNNSDKFATSEQFHPYSILVRANHS